MHNILTTWHLPFGSYIQYSLFSIWVLYAEFNMVLELDFGVIFGLDSWSIKLLAAWKKEED